MFGRLASAYFYRQPGAVMDKVPSLLHIIGCKDCKIYMNSFWQREAISQRLPPARRWHLPTIQMAHDAHTGHRLISMLKRELTCTCVAFYPHSRLNNKVNFKKKKKTKMLNNFLNKIFSPATFLFLYLTLLCCCESFSPSLCVKIYFN